MTKERAGFDVPERDSTEGDSTSFDGTSFELATVGQRLLWSLDRLRGESGALNCPMVCFIDGPLEVEQVGRALRDVMATHTALRTTIVPGRILRQRFHPERTVAIDFRDLGPDGETAAALVLGRELRTRVDPTISPVRVSLFKVAPRSHLLIVNMHHIVTDLWSSRVLLEDLVAALGGHERPDDGGEPSWDNATYSRWERGQIERGCFARQQRYWFERLVGMSLIAPSLNASRSDRMGSTGLMEARVDSVTRSRLEAIGRSTQSSSFAVLLAVLFSMSWRETGKRDLAVASLFANRSRPQLRRTVGFLVNMLMLRVRMGRDPSFLDFVEQSRRAVAGALANADLPYHALSPPPAGLENRGSARPDDLVFHAVPEPIDQCYQAGRLKIRAVVPEVIGRFDVELAVRPVRDELVVRLTFNDRRLEPQAAKRLLDAYVGTARLVADAPEPSLCREDSAAPGHPR